MSRLSKQAISDFQKIYSEAFGVEVDKETAQRLGQHLLELINLLTE